MAILRFRVTGIVEYEVPKEPIAMDIVDVLERDRLEILEDPFLVLEGVGVKWEVTGEVVPFS